MRLLPLMLVALVGCASVEPKPTIRAGAYYFDGWSGQTDDMHIPPKLRNEFAEREPVWGWHANTPAIMKQQIDAAADGGLSFFAFDWYYPEGADKRTPLNNGLELYLRAPNRERLDFCIMLTNAPPFRVGPADWEALSGIWVDLFKQRGYVTVDGEPLLIVFSHRELRAAFGGSDGVRKALASLDESARRTGLRGVKVAAVCLPGPENGWVDLNLLADEGYDCFTGYSHYGYPRPREGRAQPYDDLVAGHVDIWNRFAAKNVRPYIPVVTTGWDPRPWEKPGEDLNRPYWLYYADRSPAKVKDFVSRATRWIESNRTATTKERLLLLFAWNENGEGGYLTPTKTEGDAYLRAVREGTRSAKGPSPAAR